MTEGINPHCNAIDWMPFSIFSSSITFTLVNQVSFIAGGSGWGGLRDDSGSRRIVLTPGRLVMHLYSKASCWYSLSVQLLLEILK